MKKIRLWQGCLVLGVLLLVFGQINRLDKFDHTAAKANLVPIEGRAKKQEEFMAPRVSHFAAGSDDYVGQEVGSSAFPKNQSNNSLNNKILDYYQLSELEIDEQGSLKIHHDLHVTFSNLFDALAGEQLVQHRAYFKAAIASRYGDKAAEEFGTLLVGYDDYYKQISQLDDEMNRSGYISEQTSLAKSLKEVIQDDVFGYERSGGLFLVERQLNASMEYHANKYSGSLANMSPKEREEMNLEYERILESRLTQ